MEKGTHNQIRSSDLDAWEYRRLQKLLSTMKKRYFHVQTGVQLVATS